MGGWKDYGIFCHNEGLDPDSAYSHRAYGLNRKGLPWGRPELPEIDGIEALTWDQINQVTNGVSGTINVPCPYCGADKPYSTRMRITRTLLSAEWHCFYCGENGKALNPEPVSGELVEQDAKLVRDQEEQQRRSNFEKAMAIWNECVALMPNTRGYQYLKARKLDLPPNSDEVLRWHPHCPFGRNFEPCIVALFRDAITNEPTGIHRIHPIGGNAEKMSLGSWPKGNAGIIKLWLLGTSKMLAVSEGIENALAAVRLGIAVPPAWAACMANNLARFPVIGGITYLLILADKDASARVRRRRPRSGTPTIAPEWRPKSSVLAWSAPTSMICVSEGGRGHERRRQRTALQVSRGRGRILHARGRRGRRAE